MQTFEKGVGARAGCEFKGFTKGGSDFEAKIRGVNSVSGENLHDFEIISPAGGKRWGCERTPARPCVRACILTSNHSEFSSRDTQHWYNDNLFVRSQLLSLTYIYIYIYIFFFFFFFFFFFGCFLR